MTMPLAPAPISNPRRSSHDDEAGASRAGMWHPFHNDATCLNGKYPLVPASGSRTGFVAKPAHPDINNGIETRYRRTKKILHDRKSISSFRTCGLRRATMNEVSSE